MQQNVLRDWIQTHKTLYETTTRSTESRFDIIVFYFHLKSYSARSGQSSAMVRCCRVSSFSWFTSKLNRNDAETWLYKFQPDPEYKGSNLCLKYQKKFMQDPKQDPDADPKQSKKSDPDPDPKQSVTSYPDEDPKKSVRIHNTACLRN